MKKAIVNLSRLSASDKVIKAQTIKDAMQGSGNFPAGSMPIAYPAIQALITNLHNAVLAASADSASPTDTSNMHEQERLLVSAFNFIKAHVEFVANNTTDPATIITSAGMQVALYGGANAVTDLTIDALGGGNMTVRLPRLAGEKAFVVETSTDGGATWVQAGMSSVSKLKLTGYVAGSSLLVRYYAIGKLGKGITSQAKTIIVT